MLLGKLNTAFLAFAQVNGVKSEQCTRLAKLFSRVVDFNKEDVDEVKELVQKSKECVVPLESIWTVIEFNFIHLLIVQRMQTRLELWKKEEKSALGIQNLQNDVDYQLLSLPMEKNENINLDNYIKVYSTRTRPIYPEERKHIVPTLCHHSCLDFSCNNEHEPIDVSKEIELFTEEIKKITQGERM